jgi:thiamine-monophosphate kinase
MREEEVIDLIKKRLKMKSRSVVAGPGDDTAVLEFNKTYYLLLTTDCVVENIHFKRKEATLFQIGRKSMVVNLSDIASMGGIPLYALASVGLPAGFSRREVTQLLNGMQEASDKYNFDIVGGNLTKSPVLFVDISLVGKVEKRYLKMRSGAKPGDSIFVTGLLGGTLVKKHLNAVPRIEESRHIIRSVPVTAMMDISDGISSDLTRMAKASGTGFVLKLDSIPVSKDAFKISRTKKEAVSHALNDGEDYELLFTVPSVYKDRVLAKVNSVPVTCIGEITKEKKYIGFWDDLGVEKIEPAGYSHF